MTTGRSGIAISLFRILNPVWRTGPIQASSTSRLPQPRQRRAGTDGDRHEFTELEGC
jgi:hypothetical protein